MIHASGGLAVDSGLYIEDGCQTTLHAGPGDQHAVIEIRGYAAECCIVLTEGALERLIPVFTDALERLRAERNESLGLPVECPGAPQ